VFFGTKFWFFNISVFVHLCNLFCICQSVFHLIHSSYAFCFIMNDGFSLYVRSVFSVLLFHTSFVAPVFLLSVEVSVNSHSMCLLVSDTPQRGYSVDGVFSMTCLVLLVCTSSLVWIPPLATFCLGWLSRLSTL
jgi:hypothetical protein